MTTLNLDTRRLINTLQQARPDPGLFERPANSIPVSDLADSLELGGKLSRAQKQEVEDRLRQMIHAGYIPQGPQEMTQMLIDYMKNGYHQKDQKRPRPAVHQGFGTAAFTNPFQPTSWLIPPSPSTPPAPAAGRQTAVKAPVKGLSNPLSNKDEQTAAFIDRHLAKEGSPAADAKSPSAGQMMVKAGKQHGVDPLVLLSISKHETGHGTLGVGMQKMLGVSAYDSNPSNTNPKFDGLRNQIFAGAETFANLREGRANKADPISAQLEAVNEAGWATDPNWHQGVAGHYQDIAGEAKAFAKKHPVKDRAPQNGRAAKVDTSQIPDYQSLAAPVKKAAREAVAMGLTVTSTTGGTHTPTSNHYKHNSADGLGHAIDVAGPADRMAAFYERYAGTSPRELYYDPLGGIKDGQQIGAIGGHSDHVHLAM